MLDNGASTSVIDRAFAEEHKLDHGAIARMLMKTIRGGFEFGQGAKLAIGGLRECDAPGARHGLLSQAAGDKLIGIVGEEFFKRHVVEVDFITKSITLYDRRAFLPPPDLCPAAAQVEVTAKTRMPRTIEGEGGQEITFDLGSAGFALIDEGKLADRMLADGRPGSRAPAASCAMASSSAMTAHHDGEGNHLRRLLAAATFPPTSPPRGSSRPPTSASASTRCRAST